MRRVLGWLPGALIVLAAVVLAVLAAFWQAIHDQADRARILSGVILERAEETSDQMADAFRRMAEFGTTGACSPAGVTAMRRIDLGSSLLQGVGFAEGNRLICSSLDEQHAYDLGPPDIVSAPGNSFRTQRALPMAPEAPVLMLTTPEGYTAFIHPSLIFVLSDRGEKLPAGIVGYSTRHPLLWSAPLDIDWVSLGIDSDTREGVTIFDAHLVAWKRSADRDIFSYAAVPFAAISDQFMRLAVPFALAGAVLGIILAYLARRLSLSRASLPTLLRAGITRGEILVVYQPIVDLKSGSWVGAEALARWRRRSGEWVPPDVFIPIAEQHGLIGAITQVVSRTAISEFADLARKGLFISINLSPADLMVEDLAGSLKEICRLERVDPRAVHLELTERQDASEPVMAQAVTTLRGLGFAVGLDDFGMGYSNLAYLDTLPLDYIKVDRAFVSSAGGAGPGGEILDHIIALARLRRLEVIAEGVENAEQRDGLLQCGVRFGQGWLFGRPMSMRDFIITRPRDSARQSPASVRTEHAA